MRRRLQIRPRAAEDVEAYAVYLEVEAGEGVSDRFLASAQSSFASLQRFPLRGRPRSLEAPRLRGLRSWPVDGFPSVLIYYRVTSDLIDVIRIIHSARDLGRLDFS